MALTPAMRSFHDGEIAVQERTGQRAMGARLERAIHDEVSKAAARFLTQVWAVAVSAASPDGRLFASVWFGTPGFITAAPDGGVVSLRRARLRVAHDDSVHQAVRLHDRVGMLAMDFATRRRLRINGTVVSCEDEEMVVAVEEAFPNCSMYIQRREPSVVTRDTPPAVTTRGFALDQGRRALIGRADTAFVASMHPERGLDVSHRGGPPGFIVVESERTLLIPDYPGNSMFATLGNFVVSPRAGLAIVDFDAHRVLSMTGEARVCFDGGNRPGTAGSGRFWRMDVDAWVELAVDTGIDWMLVERSPFNPPATIDQSPGG